MKTKIYAFRISEDLYNMFVRKFQSCLPRFLINCVKRACEDKAFFEEMFFLDI